MIPEEKLSELKEMEKIYPDKKSLLLPYLQAVQDEYGYISDEAIEYIAKELSLNPSFILGVLTFYTYFSRKKRGKYHIQVCRNLSCSLLGAENLIDYISKRLSLKPGETSEDGRFTFSLVECLGCCEKAPVMMINNDYYTELTVEMVDKILSSLR